MKLNIVPGEALPRESIGATTAVAATAQEKSHLPREGIFAVSAGASLRGWCVVQGSSHQTLSYLGYRSICAVCATRVCECSLRAETGHLLLRADRSRCSYLVSQVPFERQMSDRRRSQAPRKWGVPSIGSAGARISPSASGGRFARTSANGDAWNYFTHDHARSHISPGRGWHRGGIRDRHLHNIRLPLRSE